VLQEIVELPPEATDVGLAPKDVIVHVVGAGVSFPTLKETTTDP
jgi:hypothetical protein